MCIAIHTHLYYADDKAYSFFIHSNTFNTGCVFLFLLNKVWRIWKLKSLNKSIKSTLLITMRYVHWPLYDKIKKKWNTMKIHSVSTLAAVQSCEILMGSFKIEKQRFHIFLKITFLDDIAFKYFGNFVLNLVFFIVRESDHVWWIVFKCDVVAKRNGWSKIIGGNLAAICTLNTSYSSCFKQLFLGHYFRNEW